MASSLLYPISVQPTQPSSQCTRQHSSMQFNFAGRQAMLHGNIASKQGRAGGHPCCCLPPKHDPAKGRTLQRSIKEVGTTRSRTRSRIKSRGPAVHRIAADGEHPESTSTAAKPPRPQSQAFDTLVCSHFDSCSGCSLQHSMTQPPQYWDAKQFFTSLGVDEVPLVHGRLSGWRRRAKLAVRGQAGAPLIGLFRERSHEVVPIPDCVAHHPRINDAVQLLTQVITSQRVQPFNEQQGTGLLRYLQLTVVTPSLQAPTQQVPASLLDPDQLYGGPPTRDVSHLVQVVLVVRADGPEAPQQPEIARLAQAVWHQGGPTSQQPLFHSVWVNYQPAVGTASNAVFGRTWVLAHGPRDVWEAWGGVPVCLAPGSFVQANYEAFSMAIQAMRRALPAGATQIVELHAGVGAIGLSLLAGDQAAGSGAQVQHSIKSLRCVEINPEAAPPFHASVQALHQRLVSQDAVQPELKYIVAAAGSRAAEFLSGADVVVVDPPRKGLEATLLEELAQLQWPRQAVPQPSQANGSGVNVGSGRTPRRLLYLSCGWAALKRDAAYLLGLTPAALKSKVVDEHVSGVHAALPPPPSDAWLRVRPPTWRLVSATAFLFFPGTDSIETLAVFEEVLH